MKHDSNLQDQVQWLDDYEDKFHMKCEDGGTFESFPWRAMVCQDGPLLCDLKGVRSLLPQAETAVCGLNNYTSFVVREDGTNESTIYFDDAIVSSVRVGVNLK